MTTVREPTSSLVAAREEQVLSDAPLLAGMPRRPWILAGVPSVLAAGLIVVVLALSRRGLDLMDESYVLRLASQPDSSRRAGEVYLFPFLVHPVFEAVGGDIAVFRVLSTVAISVLAAFASREVIALVAPDVQAGWLIVISALPAAAASLSVFTLGVRVLGYRSVALMGLLLVVLGLAHRFRGYQVSGGVLLGAGLCLTFVGKPTSALAVGVAVVALVLVGRDTSRRFLLGTLSGGVTGLSATLWIAGMTPRAAVDYLRGGTELARSLGGHTSIWEMVGIGPVYLGSFLTFGVPLVVFLLIGIGLLSRSEPGSRQALGLVMEFAFIGIAFAVAMVASGVLSSRGYGFQTLPLLFVVPLLVVRLMFKGSRLEGGKRQIGRFLVFLLVLPWTFAVGSNVSLSYTMSQAAVIWTIALSAVVASARYRTAHEDWFSHHALLMTACVCVVGVILQANYSDRADTADLSRATQPVRISGGVLDLNKPDASIATELLRVAAEYDVSFRTPVVDLTGMGAGYAYILGGRFLGRAHFYGTWSGGVTSARLALASESCTDVSSAWVLYSPSNPWDVSEALERFSAERVADYVMVLSFDAKRYGELRRFELYRPLNVITDQEAC